MVQLSKRLLSVAKFVPHGAILADIGSDHAYLPTYLVKKGVIGKAIAGEVVRGPYESALRNVKREKVSKYISVRLANGLQAIKDEDHVDTVTIAGMGGSLIRQILEEGCQQLVSIRHLIVQPNIHADAIRRWANENGWYITAEEILKEDGKIYEIIVLQQGMKKYSEEELLLGPFLLEENNEVFQEKWAQELIQWKRILKALDQATNDYSVKDKKKELNNKIKLVEGVLRSEKSERS